MADNGPATTSTMPEERRISVGDVQVNGDRNVLPSASKIVASYNWSTTSTSGSPHLIAPGAARMYVSPSSRRGDPRNVAGSGVPRLYVPPRRRGFTLVKDYAVPVVDENATRMNPFSSMEPLLHSLDMCSPGFDMGTVDIVTDRNNLRKLLRFCRSPAEKAASYMHRDFQNEPFKLFVHSIGEDREEGPTLVFTRATTGGLEPHYPGYGLSFEKKLTEEGPHSPPDTGRFSVVAKMNLDGISLLVRSKVDAREAVPTTSSGTPDTGHIEDEPLNEQLRSMLVSSADNSEPKMGTSTSSDNDPSSPGGRNISTSSSGLKGTRSGDLLGDEPQILELKTKSERYANDISWKDFYWQMALGCAHKLVLGLHNRGSFDRVEQLPIDEVKARAERTGSSSLVYLANTLREVMQAAHHLMVAPPSSHSGKDGRRVRPTVVVEHSPAMARGKATLRVRLAVPTDGAVAP